MTLPRRQSARNAFPPAVLLAKLSILCTAYVLHTSALPYGSSLAHIHWAITINLPSMYAHTIAYNVGVEITPAQISLMHSQSH